MPSVDQLTRMYYSPEVRELHARAQQCARMAMLTGVVALLLFGLLGIAALSLLAPSVPAKPSELIPFFGVGGIAVAILSVTSCIYLIKRRRLNRRADAIVEGAMRAFSQSGSGH